MRKCIYFLLNLILVFIISSINTSAAEFSAFSEGTKPNRIFTLEIYLYDETSSFCAAMIEVKYDPNILEFRGTNTVIDNADIKAFDDGEKIHVIFLSDDPIDCDETTEILGLDFISKSGGSGNFEIKISEAVDADANNMPVNEVFSCPYSATEKSGGDFYIGSTKSGNFKIKTSSGNSNNNNESDDEFEPSLTQSSNNTSVKLKSVYPGNDFFISAIVIGAVILTLSIFKLVKIKISSAKKDSENKDRK